ncbi:MAG: lysylphosphatidylglycerol synthase transmembrane domain-containing protein [Chloroflexia bacterium]
MIQWQVLRRRLLLFLGIGLLVFLGLAVWGGIREVWKTFLGFRWVLMPLALGFTALNYVLRWWKWHYYLQHLGIRDVGWYESALLFTAGMTMAVTPGKLGEVFKSYLLKRLNGTPISLSAPIVVAERLTDGLGMLLIAGAAAGAAVPGFGERSARLFLGVAIGLLLAAALLVLVAQNRRLAVRLLALAERFRVLRTASQPLSTLCESTYQLLQWKPLLAMTLQSALSWFGECIAVYYVLYGLGAAPGAATLWRGSFIFAAGTLLGLVSFLPGGLLVTDVSYAGLIHSLNLLDREGAATASFLIRLFTLWFGVSLGVLALFLLGRRLGSLDESPEFRKRNML